MFNRSEVACALIEAMMRLQSCDDVDEVCSFARIHLALPHPAIGIGLGDDPLVS
ncbi:MAG: hypothetical protein ABI380_15745 [Edaphobacter sp.]